MPVTPTELARLTRQSPNWNVAKRRVLSAYRDWLRAAPEIQTMYKVPLTVATMRTRIRQEFEQNRFINKLSVVDVLLLKSRADFQETMNFWRQATHIMSYFKEGTYQNGIKLPSNFMQGFLEGRN